MFPNIHKYSYSFENEDVHKFKPLKKIVRQRVIKYAVSAGTVSEKNDF